MLFHHAGLCGCDPCAAGEDLDAVFLIKEADVIVKNLGSFEEHNCHCESWLDHWKKYSDQRTNYCVVSGCGGKPEVGGHVQECGKKDKNSYVVPLCRACNDKKGQEIVIFDGVNLVPANVADTCGKKREQEHTVAGR